MQGDSWRAHALFTSQNGAVRKPKLCYLFQGFPPQSRFARDIFEVVLVRLDQFSTNADHVVLQSFWFESEFYET